MKHIWLSFFGFFFSWMMDQHQIGDFKAVCTINLNDYSWYSYIHSFKFVSEELGVTCPVTPSVPMSSRQSAIGFKLVFFRHVLKRRHQLFLVAAFSETVTLGHSNDLTVWSQTCSRPFRLPEHAQAATKTYMYIHILVFDFIGMMLSSSIFWIHINVHNSHSLQQS